MTGRILNGAGGLYEVIIEECAEGENTERYLKKTLLCNARGILKKDRIKPLPGDIAQIDINEASHDEGGIINGIVPRRNFLIRPPVANLDLLFIVITAVSPSPSLSVIDKMTAIAHHNNIKPVVIINKTDLDSGNDLYEIYTSSGFDVIKICAGDGIIDESQISKLLYGNTAALCGASGVGKTSIINLIVPGLSRRVSELGIKSSRGRHTTRATELIPHKYAGYIADTPGFSHLDFERFNFFSKDDLIYSFPDLAQYSTQCRFTKCSHNTENGCAVIEAFKNKLIATSRYESYIEIYNQLSVRNIWN